jgi:HlyD family secretion protein
VTFTVDAHRDRIMTGRVEKVLLNARIQGNFVTYDVLVAVDGPTTMLLPHMTADVEFETVKREKAWLVPTDSLVWWPTAEQMEPTVSHAKRPAAIGEIQEGPRQGDDAIVWVPVGDGRVRPLQVHVGIDDGVLSEVIGKGFQEKLPVVVGTVKETTLARLVPSVKTLR